MNSELWRLGACEVAQGIREGQFSSREVIEGCLDRIGEVNVAINALTEIRAEAALAAADAAPWPAAEAAFEDVISTGAGQWR